MYTRADRLGGWLLARFGATAMTTPPRLQALSVPRHACQGSGACCAAFRVGPLTREDVQTVLRGLPLAETMFPGQVAGSPFQEQKHAGKPASFLRKHEGFCVFYRAEVGCTLHAAAGPASKPFLCRLFPLQLVEDDGVVRIGVRPTCLSDGASWKDGPAVPGEAIAAALAHPEGILRRPPVDREDLLLELVSDPSADTSALLRTLSGRHGDFVEEPAQRWLQGAWERLVACARTVTGVRTPGVSRELQQGEHPPWPDDAQGPLHPRSPTGALFLEIASWEAARSDRGRWPEVHPRHLPHTRNALLRLVFLRQTTLHPTPAWALLAYVASARWASLWAGPDDSLRFGRAFATLLILWESPRVQHEIHESGPPFP